MKKRTKHKTDLPQHVMPKLIFLMTCFLIGSIIGSFFAANLSVESQTYLTICLKSSDSFAGGIKLGNYITVDLLLLVMTFLSACLRASVLVVPLTLTAKGFFISLWITFLVKVFNFSGYPAVFAASFIPAFLSTACLLVLGTQAMQFSQQRRRVPRIGHRISPVDRTFCLSAAVCAAVTVLASAMQFYITPMIERLFC